MKGDKYISTRQGVSGFSFANLGLFTGFGGGIINAVYSLIILDIWGSAAKVGVYLSAYYAFGLIVMLLMGEAMRVVSKARLFYASMLSVFACYVMLSLSIKPATFVALDFFTEVPLVFISILIPLFMADFAGGRGIAGMNGRYHFWLNAGALLAPLAAMRIADAFGNRSAFFASGLMYLLGWAVFKRFRIVQEDKKIPKLSPKRTLRSVWRGVAAYFKKPDFRRAYALNIGYYAMKSLRLIYWPILVVESGFSKDALGLALTLGIIPFVLLTEPVGRIARRYGPNGTRIGMAIGVGLFSLCAVAMFFTGGYAMMALYMLMQVAGAIQEPLHDLVFFDVAGKSERGRFYGIFNTSTNLTNFIMPLVGSAFIITFGRTGAIWLAAAVFGIITTLMLLSRGKTARIAANKRN